MISIIIMADKPINRMRSYGPVSLVEINGRPLIEWQIEILQNIYPESEIVVIGGFEIDKLNKFLYNRATIIGNQFWQITNSAYGLKLAITYAESDRVLVVDGNMVFNQDTFCRTPESHSCIVYDPKLNQKSEEIGMTISDDCVACLSYGLSPKWGNAYCLMEYELHLAKKILRDHTYNRLFSFEILNKIINSGGQFLGYNHKDMRIIGLNRPSDLKLAKEVV